MEQYLNFQEIEVTYKNQIPREERIQIKNSYNAYNIMRPVFERYMEYKEVFYIMLVNNQNQVLGISKIGEGTITGTLVDVRIIFQTALKAHAVGIFLFHNHPSGVLKPSEADLRLTKRITSVSELLEIRILDHLIITADGYFSFADEHLL